MNILDTRKWVPNLDLVRPIDERDIEEFRQWITYSTFKQGYRRGIEPYPGHLGLDFISYLDIRGKEHFNLDKKTVVRAIADGDVKAIDKPGGNQFFRDYQTYLILQHNSNGLSSGYCHIAPIVKVGQKVGKGQPIGTLYDQPEPEGLAVPTHLHFELGKYVGKGSENSPLIEHADPEIILPHQNNLFIPKNSLH